MNNPSTARLTGIRREVKYLVDSKLGEKVLNNLLEKVPAKHTNGSPSSFRVSIYLDDDERTLSAAELENHKVVTKMRIREYYILDGALPLFGEKCFLETKTRSGQMVEKSRFEVDRTKILKVLNEGPRALKDSEDRSAREAFEEIRNGKPLHPIFVVHYRRYTLQDKENRIRLTFDDMLSYHMPPANILSSEYPVCSRKDLPPPFLIEPNWIIEVKSIGAVPLWIDEILSPDKQIQYSKFGAGVRELERNHKLFKKGA